MGRAPCCDKANVKKGPWSPEEDSKLREYMEKYGTGGNWIALPKKAGLKRCGKSCRLRWLNYLRPNIKHGEFSEEEDTIICSLFATIGSRWSIIAAQLPGRTDNDIKNYWNTKLKKKLMGMVASSHTSNPPPPFPSPLQTPSFSSLLLQQKNCSTPTPYYTPSVANIVEPFDPIIQSNLMHSYNIPSLLETQEKLGLLGHNPMQYGYYPGGKYNLFMFGSEASTCSTYIKQEAAEMNSQNYIYNGVEENGSSGCFFGNNSTVQLGYEETEDVKQMMISGSTETNGCNDTFFSGDKKTQEKAMMYYY